MQLASSCPTQGKCQRCLKESRCIYRALKVHYLASCLIQSMTECFLDRDLAKKLGLSTEPLPVPWEANALDEHHQTHSCQHKDSPQSQ